jgi:hypothetical protein
LAKNFSSRCVNIFKYGFEFLIIVCAFVSFRENTMPYEFKVFLLDLLEADYAVVLDRFSANGCNVVSKSQVLRTKIVISSMADLECVPLA